MIQKHSSDASKAYWLSFAVSRFAISKNLTPDFVFPILLKFGVMDFLDKHYETEHLENIIYVIEDMDNILKRNGGSLE
ncbi:MAG: DUF3791 domain-containing protein [Treponema sp.]|nr:DUF3791 domain-containing protein [Treponema sp.]